jgi:hypothetical protein
MLSDNHFLFWLSFFHLIMLHVNLLCDQLQSRNANSSTVLSAVSIIRNEISLTSDRRAAWIYEKKTREDLGVLAKEVCDLIWFQAKEWFKFIGHLPTTKLLVSEQFLLYNREFPLKKLDETLLTYPMLNNKRLRTKISVFHERKEFRKVSGVSNLQQIISIGLKDSLSEVYCLLKITLTTPMTTAEPQ